MMGLTAFLFIAVRIKLSPTSETLIWKPSFPHTIVLFSHQPNSSLIVEVLDSENRTRHTLSKHHGVVGVNFGTDVPWGLRFTRGDLSEFEFEVFEPAEVPEYYMISTSRRENFALGSPGLCAWPDFGIGLHMWYGLFYLNKNPSIFTNTISEIAADDSFRYAVHNSEERPLLTEVGQGDSRITKTHNFSEWSLKVSNTVANRSVVLLVREHENGTWHFPAIRAMFTSTSPLTVLWEVKMARRGTVSDDPCRKNVQRTGEPRRTWKNPRTTPNSTVENKVINEGGTEGDVNARSQDGGSVFIGLGTILLFGFVIWRLRRKPERRAADMDGLLDRTGASLENDEF
jgi:hypothetical protein